jgi:hypothetical protein
MQCSLEYQASSHIKHSLWPVDCSFRWLYVGRKKLQKFDPPPVVTTEGEIYEELKGKGVVYMKDLKVPEDGNHCGGYAGWAFDEEKEGKHWKTKGDYDNRRVGK